MFRLSKFNHAYWKEYKCESIYTQWHNTHKNFPLSRFRSETKIFFQHTRAKHDFFSFRYKEWGKKHEYWKRAPTHTFFHVFIFSRSPRIINIIIDRIVGPSNLDQFWSIKANFLHWYRFWVWVIGIFIWWGLSEWVLRWITHKPLWTSDRLFPSLWLLGFWVLDKSVLSL